MAMTMCLRMCLCVYSGSHGLHYITVLPNLSYKGKL